VRPTGNVPVGTTLAGSAPLIAWHFHHAGGAERFRCRCGGASNASPPRSNLPVRAKMTDIALEQVAEGEAHVSDDEVDAESAQVRIACGAG